MFHLGSRHPKSANIAGAGASHPVSARSRSMPTPRSAPSRPVSFSRIRSLSAWLHPPCPMRALSFPCLCLVILSCSPPPVRGLSCACARFGGCCRSPPCQNPHRTRSRWFSLVLGVRSVAPTPALSLCACCPFRCVVLSAPRAGSVVCDLATFGPVTFGSLAFGCARFASSLLLIQFSNTHFVLYITYLSV